MGASPSLVRAALMGGLALFTYHLGRLQVGLLTLALVAAVMALANPLILWSANFQLSFFATLGLALYAQPLEQWLEGLTARGSVWQARSRSLRCSPGLALVADRLEWLDRADH